MIHSKSTIDDYILSNGLKITYKRYPSLNMTGGCNLLDLSVSRDFRTRLKPDDSYYFSRTFNSMRNLSTFRIRSWRKFMVDLEKMSPKAKKEYESLPKRLRVLLETLNTKKASKTLIRKLGYNPKDFIFRL